jgi:DNA-binding transcriptional LysR family regulator
MSRHADLETFLAVIDHGSFSAAARALGQTPSAVGKRIAQLEARLGVGLLHRSTRRMALTEAGGRYAEEAREIACRLAELEEDLANSSGRLSGTVRMTVPSALGRLHVAPAVIRFMQAHSDVEIDLLMTDRNVDLVAEGIDLAVRTGVAEDSTLIARRVTRYARTVCATPDYLARAGRPHDPRALAGHRCLKLAREVRPGDWGLGGAGGSIHRLGRGLRCNSLETLHAACLAGEGIACLPRFLCHADTQAGRLEPVLGAHHSAGVAGDISILRPETAVLPSHVRALIEFLVADLKRAGLDTGTSEDRDAPASG